MNDSKIKTASNQLDAIKSRVKPGFGNETVNTIGESVEREYKGVRIVDNVEAGKCRLFFKGIPAPKIRTYLKKHEFQWSAADRCWQADRNGQANYYAEKAIDKMG